MIETARQRQMIHFDRFSLDLGNEELRDRERPLALTPKAFAVLAHLVQHAERKVDKAELLDAVWGERHVSDAVLKVAVREIRTALGDEARTPRFIETLHRRGYRFIGRLTEAGSGSAEATATMVGREQALERLRDLYRHALAGSRQMVFVTGEPGIGKTTLVEAFLRELAGDQPCWIAVGRSLEHFGASEAYLPVLEALTRLCREPWREKLVALLYRHAPTWLAQLPSLIDSQARQQIQHEILGATQQRMLREMADAIEALTADKPLVLVLEDLHWSDYATLDLISLLARRPEAARFLLIGTFRPADAQLNQHPLRHLKGELETRRAGLELGLDELGPAAVETYLRLRLSGRPPAGLAQLIHEHTNGHPLFMVNVVDYLQIEEMLVEEADGWCLARPLEAIQIGVPDSIRQLIEQQIDRLDHEEQELLAAASAVGTELSAAAVAAALECELIAVEDGLDRLARRHTFLASSGLQVLPNGTVAARYMFVHSLYQQVLYQRLSPARRRRLHLRIGEEGERVYGEQTAEIAAELAMHFEHAHDEPRAVRYLQQAAATAVERHANREAETYLSRALALVDNWPEDKRLTWRLELLRQRGRVRRSMGEMANAAADFEVLVAYAEKNGRIAQATEGLLYSVSALYWIRREACLEKLDRAAAMGRQIEDPLQRATSLGYCAHWNLNLRGWNDEDAAGIRHALGAARQARDPSLLSLHVVRDVYLRCWESDYEGATVAATEGSQLSQDVGDPFDFMVCRFFWGWACLHAGRWQEIGPLLRRAIDMAEKNANRPWALMFQIELAWLHEQAFDPERARQLCEEALEEARRHPQETGQLLFKSLIVLGTAHLGLGRLDEALHNYREIRRVIEDRRVLMDQLLYLPFHEGLSRYWLIRGQPELARREAQRLCALARPPGERTYLALGHRILAEIAMVEEAWATAEAELQLAFDCLDDDETPLAAWQVCATGAALARRRDEPVAAAGFAERGAGILRRLAAVVDDPCLRDAIDHRADTLQKQ